MAARDDVARWALLRLDDNGNRFMVAVFPSRHEALAAMRGFEAHGHKQTYWVETVTECEARSTTR